MSEYTQQEAYILGCLYGRGSIEEEPDGFKLILRFPHVPYDPIGETIIKALLRKKDGLTAEEMRQLPEIKRRGIENLGLKLNKLRKWHPPRIEVCNPLLVREGKIWKIYDEDLAHEYLSWQKKYLKRENAWMRYVVETIQNVSSFMASNIRTYFETGAFGHTIHVVECKIQPIAMKYLRDNYGLDVGDVYMHNSPSDSKTIFEEYDKELKEWFIRGLADTIATIDRYIHSSMPFYRVQFSVINNNTRLPIDICLLLQKHIGVPVYYIGWASIEEGEDADEEYTKRGGRDHLVKIWVVNFERKFDLPLFMHEQKDIEFQEALDISKKSLKQNPKLEKLLTPCPRGMTRKYIEFCLKCGCKQIKNKQPSIFDVL